MSLRLVYLLSRPKKKLTSLARILRVLLTSRQPIPGLTDKGLRLGALDIFKKLCAERPIGTVSFHGHRVYGGFIAFTDDRDNAQPLPFFHSLMTINDSGIRFPAQDMVHHSP